MPKAPLMPDNETQTSEAEEVARLLGATLSDVAQLAAQVLRRTGAYSVLCPGCGHGECSAYLARRGFRVTAYDVSERTITRVSRNAELAGVKVECFVDDVVVPQRRLRQYDAVFSHNMLHQVRASQRRALLRGFYQALRHGGILILSVLSADDERYGYGRQIEPNTFEFSPGESLHFYTKYTLEAELAEFFEVAQIEEVEEVHTFHGLGTQRYRLLVATAVKL